MSQDVDGQSNTTAGGSVNTATFNGPSQHQQRLEQDHKTLRKMIATAKKDHAEISNQIRIRSILASIFAILNLVLMGVLISAIFSVKSNFASQKAFHTELLAKETMLLEHYIHKTLIEVSERHEIKIEHLKDKQDDRIKELLTVHADLSSYAWREISRSGNDKLLIEVRALVEAYCGPPGKGRHSRAQGKD